MQKKAIETENTDFFAPGIWTCLGPFERTKEDNNITTQQSKGGGERVGGVGEWIGIMCMIPRPCQIQFEQKNSDFLHALDLDLPWPF